MSVISPTDHFSGCFGILTKLNAKNTDNIKYSKTQFFQKVSKPSNSYDSSTRITVQTHKYQRVSTPESFVRTSKFQQKGIIFIWPQKKTHFRDISAESFWESLLYTRDNVTVPTSNLWIMPRCKELQQCIQTYTWHIRSSRTSANVFIC
ncbi:uncharacterized protein LOC130901840 isoform X2 [Diorhabda carinulata]|uniref:uncharacterized protein LOC130901840 isoform X2 n=1 Tax=Diorhabda carinulata TaxID=1163345 RepID=UPI0025A2C713|nr:uncharacterized protein LOC130901840 isoform X2 [Diorhabda carinulata]